MVIRTSIIILVILLSCIFLYSSMSKESPYMYEMLGMNLLKLLSQNRIMEFHLELELFVHSNTDKALNDPYIKKAVEMEQYLTEGRYNKVAF